MRTIKIGSRASNLAITQAEIIINELKNKFPRYKYEIIKILTKGDKILDKTLDKIGGKGLFVKEIQMALINKEIDLAVHSMKDMPVDTPEELLLGAMTQREDPRDVLVSKNNTPWSQLPQGAVIGSSSLRRQTQLINLNPSIKVQPIRGNVETRMKKIDTESLDGVILAAAGLKRLGLKSYIAHYFDAEEVIPAVGQGALGCEIRQSDEELYNMLQAINHEETYKTVMAERSFLRVMDGGCHFPIGAYAKKVDDKIILTSMVGDPQGKVIISDTEEGDFEEYIEIGERLGKKMLLKGAKDILNMSGCDKK